MNDGQWFLQFQFQYQNPLMINTFGNFSGNLVPLQRRLAIHGLNVYTGCMGYA